MLFWGGEGILGVPNFCVVSVSLRVFVHRVRIRSKQSESKRSSCFVHARGKKKQKKAEPDTVYRTPVCQRLKEQADRSPSSDHPEDSSG